VAVTQANPAIETKANRLTEAEGWWARQSVLTRFLYWGLHAACLLGFVVGVSTGDFVLFLATFFGRMFFITGGYHRYFSHKSFKTGRVFQFVLAWFGASSVQKGPLWWAGHHRIHHKYSDQPGLDTHSPRDGFYWSHQGWIFDSRFDGSDLDQIRDFAAYPELVWLNRWHVVPPVALALACLAIGGWSGLVWGFVISTVALWHSTYSINSIAHRIGTRRYATSDDSRNNWFLGLLTFGEGWHNNHHHYCASARQGFFWWEVDVTYYLLRGLQALGIVWDLREPPAHIRNLTIEARAAEKRAA
jgi:stearoyl-CoA desaturase (delta-9 desaturase)